MTKISAKRSKVKFFATSRLADAYRSAVRRNKRLARNATIHELGSKGSHLKSIGHGNAIDTIVLSHADDDHMMCTGSESNPLLSKAFHLVFAEPTTHPEQIAHWMRTNNVRSENRLHFVRVPDLSSPQIAELLCRVCDAFGSGGSHDSIVDVRVGGDVLHVLGPKQRMLHVPITTIRSLRNQPRSVLENYQLDPDGAFVYWPDIDVHLGWSQFLQAVDPAELHKAHQRSTDFNRRYGAAVRKLRQKTGISQVDVVGVSERQLRRIERGECRATMGALKALAEAHGLEVGEYMELLAKKIE